MPRSSPQRAATFGRSGWPLQVDEEVVLPLARARRARLEAGSSRRRGSSAARGCRAPRTAGSAPRRSGWCSRAPRQPGAGWRSGWARMAKRVRLWGLVLDRRRHHVQAELAAGARWRWRRRASPAARRAPSALLATGRRSACGRCSDSQPWHCASACGCAQTADALERILAAQRVVAHQQAGLADDEQGRGQEQVERRVTTPSVEFSTGTMPKSAEPATVLCSTFVEGGAGHLDDGRTEEAQRRFLAEGAGRAEVGHASASRARGRPT